MLAIRTPALTRELRWLLFADSAVEAACGVALLTWREKFQSWLGINEIAAVVIGSVFLLAALIPLALVLTRAPASSISALARANIAGGTVGWLALPFIWSYLEPEGRWIAAAVFDVFIALGVAELIALRRART